MKPEPGKCPVTGMSHAAETSSCPMQQIFGWLREQVAHATKILPLHNNQDARKKELIKDSIIFADYLIPLIRGLTPGICERTDRVGDADKITSLFLSSNRKAEDDISQIFTLNLIDERMKTENEAKELGISADAHTSILANYQTGIRVVIKLWRSILKAYKVKNKTWPTRVEMSSYRDFIMNFSHGMGASPNFFSQGIIHDILDSSGGGFYLDKDARARVKIDCLETLYDAHDFLEDEPAGELRQNLTGASCPALPKIREIAEACCIVLEECYEHVLRK